MDRSDAGPGLRRPWWPAQSARADVTPSTLTVTLGGDGAGAITSDTGGIDCAAGTCTAPFDPTASVTLTAAPAPGSVFTGFGGGVCAGLTCTVPMSADATVTADFDRLPTLTAPADGTAYSQASVPAAAFACAAGDTSCTATLDRAATPIRSGDPLSATPGAHALSVSGVAADGATVTRSASYTVIAPPTARIAAPVDNAAYVWPAIPAADFTCVAGVGSTVQSCRAAVAGQPVADHQALPNGFGAHVLTVTATDADGQSVTVSAAYAVAAPPSRRRRWPSGLRRRARATGWARRWRHATSAGPPPPGRRCGHAPAPCPRGARSTPGRWAGMPSASRPPTPRALRPPRRSPTASCPPPTASRSRGSAPPPAGAARLALKLPGPGSVRVLATAWNAAAGAAARHVPYGTASVGARRAGPLSVVVAPAGAGRALLRTHGVAGRDRAGRHLHPDGRAAARDPPAAAGAQEIIPPHCPPVMPST